MSIKRHSAEQIIHKLREAAVLISQGQTVAQVCKQIGVIDQTYYRWRKEYGGLKTDQAKRFKERVLPRPEVSSNGERFIQLMAPRHGKG